MSAGLLLIYNVHFVVFKWQIATELFLDDLDELEVYGKEEQSGVPLTSYTFEV